MPDDFQPDDFHSDDAQPTDPQPITETEPITETKPGTIQSEAVQPGSVQSRLQATSGGWKPLQGLVAVAAFSILVALLWTHFNPSPQSLCASNMRQLGLALTQYTQDNDQSFPPRFFEGPQGWAGRIYPYIKTAAPYKCSKDTTLAHGSAVPVSYGINSNLVSPLPALKDPASTVLLFEVSGAQVEINKIDEDTHNFKAPPPSKIISPCGQGLPTANGGDPFGPWGGGGQVSYATGDLGGRGKLNGNAGSSPRHDRGSNFLGGDGHVTYLLPGQVSSGADGVSGNSQDHPKAGQAAATDEMFRADGKTPVRMTFSTQ